MPDRRDFLRNAAWLAGGSLLLTRPAHTLHEIAAVQPIGLQLYTLSAVIDEDLAGTLKKVADIGYREVESASSKKGSYYGLKPREFKKMLKDLGLNWRSHHVTGAPAKVSANGNAPVMPPRKNLKENYREVIDEVAEGGVRYLVCSSTPVETLDEIRNSIEVLNRAGEQCRKAGIALAYHNHDREFMEVEGEQPYHLLLSQTDPYILKMELDIAWATKGGADPVELFTRNPGRFPLWHVKDISKDMTTLEPVGNGSIDFKRIFDSAKIAGMKHLFIEHDRPADPFGSIARSFGYVSTLVAKK